MNPKRTSRDPCCTTLTFYTLGARKEYITWFKSRFGWSAPLSRVLERASTEAYWPLIAWFGNKFGENNKSVKQRAIVLLSGAIALKIAASERPMSSRLSRIWDDLLCNRFISESQWHDLRRINRENTGAAQHAAKLILWYYDAHDGAPVFNALIEISTPEQAVRCICEGLGLKGGSGT